MTNVSPRRESPCFASRPTPAKGWECVFEAALAAHERFIVLLQARECRAQDLLSTAGGALLTPAGTVSASRIRILRVASTLAVCSREKVCHGLNKISCEPADLALVLAKFAKPTAPTCQPGPPAHVWICVGCNRRSSGTQLRRYLQS